MSLTSAYMRLGTLCMHGTVCCVLCANAVVSVAPWASGRTAAVASESSAWWRNRGIQTAALLGSVAASVQSSCTPGGDVFSGNLLRWRCILSCEAASIILRLDLVTRVEILGECRQRCDNM